MTPFMERRSTDERPMSWTAQNEFALRRGALQIQGDRRPARDLFFMASRAMLSTPLPRRPAECRHEEALSREDAQEELLEVDGALSVVVEGFEDTEGDRVRHRDVHHRQQLPELLEGELPVAVLVQCPEHVGEVSRRVAAA
mmetsp:Transcript_121805/g.339259  ORF Transcript_121805/g.339259 Transcript_121805/m.339259 type:complete len:141 (-) Transcript_121805:325-747(-)